MSTEHEVSVEGNFTICIMSRQKLLNAGGCIKLLGKVCDPFDFARILLKFFWFELSHNNWVSLLTWTISCRSKLYTIFSSGDQEGILKNV